MFGTYRETHDGVASRWRHIEASLDVIVEGQGDDDRWGCNDGHRFRSPILDANCSHGGLTDIGVDRLRQRYREGLHILALIVVQNLN